jgi:phage baseplate assembly protein W
MANDLLTKVYGRGWAFPLAFTLTDGVVMAEGAEDVKQSLRILFNTEPGDRIMREQYGCGLHDVMFENIDSKLVAEIRTRIMDGMLRYEPRANLTQLRIYESSGTGTPLGHLQIEVTYNLRGSEIEQRIAGVLDIGDAQLGRFV